MAYPINARFAWAAEGDTQAGVSDIIDLPLLMLAYRSGIFPMADARDDTEIFWVEPKRRGILPLDRFHCSHSLARSLRRGHFTVTCNAAFDAVVEACAGPRATADDDTGGTWISRRIAATYHALHQAGHAHSIECWREGALVGGLYGVGFDRVFCGESMFSHVTDASKVALAWLVAALKLGGTELLDCQFITGHLASLGAVEISQKRYLELLRHAQRTAPFDAKQAGDQRISGLASAATGAGAASGAASAVTGALACPLPEAFEALLAAAASAGSSSSPGNFIAQSFTHTS